MLNRMADMLKSDTQSLGLLVVELITQVDALRKTMEGRDDMKKTYQMALIESKDQIRRLLPPGYTSQIGSGTLSTLENALLKTIRGYL
jgi:hypothetical protein